MPSPWLAYLPYTIAQDILAHPEANPIEREHRRQTVAMFADISGFTAMSEALAEAGRAGTEELTRVLNGYFEATIALVRQYGGIVGQFGGDALTVLFPSTQATQRQTARRALRCALEMQERMGRYAAVETLAGTFKLSFKAGLAVGSSYCTSVGDPQIGLKTVVAGSALDLCATAEAVAERGNVVAHHALLPLAEPLHAEPLADDFRRVLRLEGEIAPAPLPELRGELSVRQERLLAAYLHPVIAQRIARGQSGFVNEHRKVTVLFVNFGGFDYDRDLQVGAKLQAYLGAMLRVVQQYDGYLNKVDMGDKGSKAIVLFGAPTAHEDDEERAIHCALELRALAPEVTRIGVNTGLAFCGLIGASVRQEYTVIGDAVNLSARLMQAATPGQILVSREAQRRAARTFRWQALPPIRVKGKREPIAVYAAQGVRGRTVIQTQEIEYALPMVGRKAELAIAEDRLARVLRGEGQVLGITAEAGMGKSRLSTEIIRQARAEGLRAFGGECQSYSTTASYHAWHHIWRAFFGVETSWPLARLQAHLEGALHAIDPVLAQRAPLLGAALNLPLEDDALTAGMDAKLRKASLEALLVRCVRARAAESPLLFVLEDAQWLDPLSFDLLLALARNVVDLPVLMLLVYRPPELPHIDLDALREFPHFTELALREFSRGEAETLIHLQLRRLFGDVQHIPPALVELVAGRAQGNPFYISEMLNLIHDQGIDPQDAAALEAVELPDTLHSLVISRIDRLLEDQKIALKVASVIGRAFCADWLPQVYPPVGNVQRVQRQIEALRRHDFVVPAERPTPELEYLFRHIVTQEVAYESLSVATRARLHEQVAAFIEHTFPDEIARYLDVLAYHYGHSENRAKQREYFRRAADAAAATYANDAAITYYRRLLPLLEEAERPPVLLKLGKVLELTGKWDEAEAQYRRALELAEQMSDRALRAQAFNALGRLLTSRGAYEDALEALHQARELFVALGDQQGVGRVLTNIGNVYLFQGASEQAGTFYEQAMQAAEAADNRELTATILGNWGMSYHFRGDFAQALRYLQRQVNIREALGDKHGAAIARNNIGVVYEEQGDYVQAMHNYRHFLQVAAEVGDQPGVALAVGNLGILYSLRGAYEDARRCFALQLQIGLEVGDRRVISFGLSDMADVAKKQGRTAEAERLYADAVALGRALNLRFNLCSYLQRQAALYAAQERWAEAETLNAEARALAEEVGRREVSFEAALLDVQMRVWRGKLRGEAARSALLALRELAQETEQFAALYGALTELDPQDAAARAEALTHYRALYARTGSAEDAAHVRALSGETLPPPPQLPPLPEVVAQAQADLEALLRRVETLIAALG